METKIKNLLARLAFFADEGMADAPIVAIAKDADALLKEMCRGFPEQAQQADIVAWGMSKKTIADLAAELIRGADCMGDDETELALEICMPGTVRDDDGNLNAGPVLAISDADYPEEGVYPIDPHNPTAGREPEAQQQAEPVAYPPYSVFSNSDGDSWEEHPASDCFVHGKKLGEEFELLAGWHAERVTFRVTKVPDNESDDYELEEVNPAPVATENSASVLVDALEKLARLGAGDRYGNSDGNRIAQQALATYRDYSAQPPAVADAGKLLAAIEYAEGMLTNMQPHIPQACYPQRMAFIDNYVDPVLERLRAEMADAQKGGA